MTNAMNSSTKPALDASRVKAGVLRALPDDPYLEALPCERLSQGTEHSVWSIGPYIYRALPETGRTHGKNESSVRRDAKVSELVRRYITDPSIIPHVLKTVLIDGWIGNIENKLTGRPVQCTALVAKTERDIVELLHDLSRIPVHEALEATEYEEPRPNLRPRVTKAARAWKDVVVPAGLARGPDHEMDALLERMYLDVKTVAENATDYKPILVHGDISSEHVLVDDFGKVTGIIDWSDARIGDPCLDIAGLALSVGRQAAARIGAKSLHSPGTVARGLLLAMCIAINDLADFARDKEQASKTLLRYQFTHAFQGTDLESALLLES